MSSSSSVSVSSVNGIGNSTGRIELLFIYFSGRRVVFLWRWQSSAVVITMSNEPTAHQIKLQTASISHRHMQILARFLDLMMGEIEALQVPYANFCRPFFRHFVEIFQFCDDILAIFFTFLTSFGRNSSGEYSICKFCNANFGIFAIFSGFSNIFEDFWVTLKRSISNMQISWRQFRDFCNIFGIF